MRALSNLFRGTDVSVAGSVLEYRPARPDEVHDALSLVLGGAGSPAAAEQVKEFAQFASLRGIDVRDVWVAGSGGRMIWAVLPVLSPGRTMLILTPPQVPGTYDARPLVDAVCKWAVDRGVHLAQMLADPADANGQQAFIGQGFREIAELLYLQVTVRRGPQLPDLAAGFGWHTYTDREHALFAQAIVESYKDSLDCPALSGMRDIEDVIAGHRSSGEFDPLAWFVLTERDAPVGVVLLTGVPRSDMAELVYLGLAPAARGRGLGDVLMRQAMWAVRHQMDLPRLTLAVDSRNVPALKLYYRHGMQHVGSKTAMLRDLRAPIHHAVGQPDRDPPQPTDHSQVR